eukprot:31198-Pelagococcus_subviridis.AAC.51
MLNVTACESLGPRISTREGRHPCPVTALECPRLMCVMTSKSGASTSNSSTAARSKRLKLSSLFSSNGPDDSGFPPRVPWISMYTGVSVPAPLTSAVVTVIVNLLSGADGSCARSEASTRVDDIPSETRCPPFDIHLLTWKKTCFDVSTSITSIAPMCQSGLVPPQSCPTVNATNSPIPGIWTSNSSLHPRLKTSEFLPGAAVN